MKTTGCSLFSEIYVLKVAIYENQIEKMCQRDNTIKEQNVFFTSMRANIFFSLAIQVTGTCQCYAFIYKGLSTIVF